MEERRCQKVARRLQLLSHPARLRIVIELRKGEACVSDLQAVLDRPQPPSLSSWGYCGKAA